MPRHGSRPPRRHRRRRVHRRRSTLAPRASPARAWSRRLRLDAASAPPRRPPPLGAERALRVGRGARAVADDDRRRPHLRAQPPARAARRGGAAPPASTSSARSRSRSTPPRRARLVDVAAAARPRRRRAVRLPLLPDRPRGARARAQRRDRPAPPPARHLPAGLAAAPRGRQLARRPATSAARRARSPTSARTGATSPSSSPATASPACRARHDHAVGERSRDAGRRAFAARQRRRRRCAPSTPRTPPSCSSRPTRGALGTTVISQISAGRKNRLWLEVDGARRGARLRPGAPRDAVVRAPRGDDHRAPRPRAPARPGARAWPRCRPATPRATRSASTASSTTSTTRSPAAPRPTACRPSRTACAPPRSPTPCSTSAREERWVDVPPSRGGP